MSSVCPYRAAAPRLQARARAAAQQLIVAPGYERHHWNYARRYWLDIIPLPQEMHHRAHQFIVYRPEAMCFETLFGDVLDTREKHLEYLRRVLRIPRG